MNLARAFSAATLTLALAAPLVWAAPSFESRNVSDGLKNGGFEEGSGEGWSGAEFAITSDFAREGERALRFTLGDGASAIYSPAIDVSAGDVVYVELSALATVHVPKGLVISLEIQTADGWSTWKVVDENVFLRPESWRQVIRSGSTAPHGATQARIKFDVAESTGIDALYLDDVLLYAVSLGSYVESTKGDKRLSDFTWYATDTLRPAALSCYGNDTLHTPNVDRMAAEGKRWNVVNTTCPWTKPSFASLFTSLYPSQHTTEMPLTPLPDDLTSIIELIQDAGYFTIGFAHSQPDGYLGSHMGLAQGFDAYFQFKNEEDVFYSVLEWMDVNAEHLANLEGGGIFIFYHMFEPHQPYVNWVPKLFHNSKGILGTDDFDPTEMAYHDREFNDADRVYGDQLYNWESVEMDRRIGQVNTRLRWAGLFDDMNFLLTSDHGELLPTEREKPIQWAHSRCFETVNGVPLIMRFPGKIEPGQVDETTLVSNLEVLPTLCDLLDLPTPEGIEGFSLVADEVKSRDYLIVESRRSSQISIRDDRYKIQVFNATEKPGEGEKEKETLFSLRWQLFDENTISRFYLFDLHEDPLELNDLSKERPEIYERLKNELLKHAERVGMLDEEEKEVELREMTDETLEQLEGLGYVN